MTDKIHISISDSSPIECGIIKDRDLLYVISYDRKKACFDISIGGRGLDGRDPEIFHYPISEIVDKALFHIFEN